VPLEYSVPCSRNGEQSQGGALGHSVLLLGWSQCSESSPLLLCEGCGWIRCHICVQRGSACRGSAVTEGAVQGLLLRWVGAGFADLVAEVAAGSAEVQPR